jgi:membrane protease subunit (stomatin/prohibitin family)
VAANAGTAGMGMGFGVGAALAQTISGSLKVSGNGPAGLGANEPVANQPAAAKFCASCGNGMARQAKFCCECGSAQ